MNAASGCQCQMSQCGSSCCSESCSCGCGASYNCPAGDLLDAVHAAKKCLLKDKIKERLEAKMGAHLDGMADLAVEMLMGKMEMKKQKKMKQQEMMEKMKSVMGK
jgi:hypothetical protein